MFRVCIMDLYYWKVQNPLALLQHIVDMDTVEALGFSEYTI